MLLTRARNWITANPARFAELTAQRTLLFWFPPFGKGSDNYLLWAVTLLGFVGLAHCGKTNPMAASMLGSILLLYPLIYYAIQHFTRYRYPILWVSSLMAAYALEQGWLKSASLADRRNSGKPVSQSIRLWQMPLNQCVNPEGKENPLHDLLHSCA